MHTCTSCLSANIVSAKSKALDNPPELRESCFISNKIIMSHPKGVSPLLFRCQDSHPIRIIDIELGLSLGEIAMNSLVVLNDINKVIC